MIHQVGILSRRSPFWSWTIPSPYPPLFTAKPFQPALATPIMTCLQRFLTTPPTLGVSGGLPRWLGGKASACQCRRHGFHPWVGKIPWSRKWQPTPGFWPGKFHGQRSLAGSSPCGHGVWHDWACTHPPTTHPCLWPPLWQGLCSHTAFLARGCVCLYAESLAGLV